MFKKIIIGLTLMSSLTFANYSEFTNIRTMEVSRYNVNKRIANLEKNGYIILEIKYMEVGEDMSGGEWNHDFHWKVEKDMKAVLIYGKKRQPEISEYAKAFKK